MVDTRFDKPLQQTLAKVRPNEKIIVIVGIREGNFKVETEYRYDETKKEWPWERCVIHPEVQHYVSELSTRVLFSNLEIIPAMCVETQPKQIERLAGYDFVEGLELSTKAHLWLDDVTRITRASNVWNKTRGSGALVSIVDTGISDHPTFRNKVVDSYDLTYEGEGDVAITMDEFGHYEHGHGTAVAAAVAYVAPEARLLNAKAVHAFAGPHSSPDKANVIAAIRWSIRNNASIINLSGGFLPCSDGKCRLCRAADKAVRAGIVFVTAAGNTGGAPVDCPGQARDVITVGASTKLDLMWKQSSSGPTMDGRDKPDLVAPEDGILTGCASGGEEHRTGTSFSAAVVSSAVALLRHKNTSLQDIKTAILGTAHKLIDPDTGGPYDHAPQGSGRIDIEAAYAQL